jgi:hypothetical protein
MLFLILSAMSVAIGITAGIMQIHDGWKSHPGSPPERRRFLGFIAIGTVVLAVVFFLASIVPGNGPNNTSNNAQPRTTTTALTFTPTPPATPTPTPCPSPCIAYQESGWQDWSYPSDWRIADNGFLIGSRSDTIPAAIAPFSLPSGVKHFAIQAEIAMPEDIDSSHDHSPGFGITACGSSTPNGWQGYRGGIDTDFLHLSGYVDRYAAIDRSDKQLGRGSYDPGLGFHKYYFEIDLSQGTLTLKIDGAPVVTNVVDDLYLPCGPQVGLWNAAAKVIQVKSFEVLLL